MTGLLLLKKDMEGNVPAAPPGFEPVAEITGGESSSISITVRGKELALMTLPSGKFAACDAICPHQGGKLELGAIEECHGSVSVICPRHAWAFDLSTGFCDIISDYGVQVYDTMVTEDGIVCISTSARAQPALE
eukprot:CAMPEP_0173109032 /NCGR_PEP_ID=MMETSP1102-20130122/43138_1 /TAXON_ID=49646 /ORGANISM="Geminigera sp., Strain Caron Lab Isolate" /LENGTH=133 /DNA_ID=CAMNT_0014007749 /DNA_START=15 /DNA_END=416 /DNA_ORIENTATION=-